LRLDAIFSLLPEGGSLTESRAFGAIYLSVAISYLGVGLVAPLIANVLDEHGENSFMVGLIGTTMFAAFTLASFPVGAATDRFGPKPILVGGLIVYGASIALFAFNLTTGLFFMARAIEGVGAAAISVATETMINKLSKPNERARRMSYYALSVGIGWAAGPLAGALLFSINPGFPFFACFSLSLLAALSAQALIPETASTSHHLEAISKRLTGKIIGPISAGALYGYLMSSLITLVPLYLKREMRVGVTDINIIITAVIIGTLASQVPIGRAADRFGKRKTLMTCSLVMSVAFLLMAFHSDWTSFIATGAVIGAAAGSLYPIGLAIIGGIVKKERLGASTSMFSLAFGFGSLVGPSFSGFAMTHFGNRWLFYLPAILSAAFVIEMIVLYNKIAPQKKTNL
jgi:MFS transporter, DHA1 family, multidrug resistance protein